MSSYPWNSRESWPETATFLSPLPGLIEKLRCGPVLGDKDRVISHRCLLAVVRWIDGSETLLDELLSVQHHSVQSLALKVFPFSGTKAEPATEGRSSQPLEDFIQIAVHPSSPLRPEIDEYQGDAHISRQRCGTSIGSLSLSIAS